MEELLNDVVPQEDLEVLSWKFGFDSLLSLCSYYRNLKKISP